MHYSSIPGINNMNMVATYLHNTAKKGAAIPAAAHEGTYSLEALGLQYFLDSPLTDGSPLLPSKIPGTHFCWSLI
jgi:hypothetical protein